MTWPDKLYDWPDELYDWQVDLCARLLRATVEECAASPRHGTYKANQLAGGACRGLKALEMGHPRAMLQEAEELWTDGWAEDLDGGVLRVFAAMCSSVARLERGGREATSILRWRGLTERDRAVLNIAEGGCSLAEAWEAAHLLLLMDEEPSTD